MRDFFELSPSRRAFVRDAALAGLGLGTLGACDDPPTTAGRRAAPAADAARSRSLAASSKFLLVDATLGHTGTMVSLDAQFDASLAPGSFTSPPEFCGAATFMSPRIFGGTASERYCVRLGTDYANALSLQSLGDDRFQILAGGDPQPLGAPWVLTMRERTVPGTTVTRLIAQVFDPETGQRVTLAITHDPAPVVVLAWVAGIVALICGAVILVETFINDCVKKANEQCGHGRVKSITVVRTYGFAWRKGLKVGCGSECEIECFPK